MNANFGRKTSFICGVCTLFVEIIIQSAAQNSGIFIIGRIFISYGGVTTQISAFILVAELCKAEVRGFFMDLAFETFWDGALIASGVAYATRNLPGDWN